MPESVASLAGNPTLYGPYHTIHFCDGDCHQMLRIIINTYPLNHLYCTTKLEQTCFRDRLTNMPIFGMRARNNNLLIDNGNASGFSLLRATLAGIAVVFSMKKLVDKARLPDALVYVHNIETLSACCSHIAYSLHHNAVIVYVHKYYSVQLLCNTTASTRNAFNRRFIYILCKSCSQQLCIRQE